MRNVLRREGQMIGRNRCFRNFLMARWKEMFENVVSSTLLIICIHKLNLFRWNKEKREWEWEVVESV